MAAELVVVLGAKMKEICEHQTLLIEQIQRMRQKIDQKDKLIKKLQEGERGDAGIHKKERVEMADELMRLKQQVRSMESLMEDAAHVSGADATGSGVTRQLSELNVDSGDTEEDSSTTKDEEADGQEPSTASTADGRPVSAPSSLTHSNGRYYFKPMTSSRSIKKRRNLDDLFRPKDAQCSTH